MACNMLRVQSGRLLGLQLMPSSAAASLRAPSVASHGLCSIAVHRSTGWTPLQRISISPSNVATRSSLGSNNSLASASASASGSSSWSLARTQFGRGEAHNSTTSLALQGKNAVSRRYATGGETGGGSGSGIGAKGGDGGGGGGGGEGGSGAGDEGRWRILAWYMGLLDTNPVLTKAVTFGIITFIGDVVCQLFVEKVDDFDGKRTAVMTFLGFGLMGPTLHFWYQTLNKVVKVGGPVGLGIRLVLDQLVFSPVFLGIFLSSLLTLEGKQDQISAKLKQDWAATVVANWKVWTPAQIINFTVVPLKFQVLCANFTALFWNAYLSYKSHAAVAPLEDLSSEIKP